MNREILFKAKRKDNGEWVEGYYCKWKQIRRIICVAEEKVVDSIITWMSDGSMLRHEIDSDTLCQYTGLTDKNGEKIWENDIVSIHAYSYDEPEDDYFGVVTYCEKDACWSLNNNEKYGDVICECFGSYTTEIINHGNIFDNPELLEVE